jgi:hypothetical protein
VSEDVVGTVSPPVPVLETRVFAVPLCRDPGSSRKVGSLFWIRSGGREQPAERIYDRRDSGFVDFGASGAAFAGAAAFTEIKAGERIAEGVVVGDRTPWRSSPK